MRKNYFEWKIVLLTLAIISIVLGAGYLSYHSLSKVVFAIHQESQPNYKLIAVKEISNELLDLEKNTRLYTLKNHENSLSGYVQRANSIKEKIEKLENSHPSRTKQNSLIDSFIIITRNKLFIQEQVISLHVASDTVKHVFQELYSRIDSMEILQKQEEGKENLFSRIFPKKKDTIIHLERVKHDIVNLEEQLTQHEESISASERRLVSKDKELTSKLNEIVLQLEKMDISHTLKKADELDQLASTTYKRLAVFSIAAVLLLLVSLFTISRYIRKSNAYHKVLKKAREDAEELVKTKESFIANVSHEMRTPMNAIQGLSEQLLQQKMEKSLVEKLTIIRKSVIYLSDFVNDVLDFSKMQAGKLTIEEIDFSPLQVVSEVVSLHQVIAQQKKLDLKQDIKENLPPALLGDPARLKQILHNLLNNAIKFTQSGEVTLSIKTIDKHSSLDQYTLQFIVKDTGIGIAKNKLSSIFEDFVQAGNNISRQYGGTGLGLTIVKNLIELQGGNIQVDSEEGKGTRFVFSIPYSKGKVENIEDENMKHTMVPRELKKKKFLITDDEEYNRVVLRGILQKWGVEFEEACDGMEAIKKVKENFFDLILMDIRMPIMDGWETSRKILELTPKTNIIALTAACSPTEIELCKESGISSIVPKPFYEKDLLESVLLVTKPGSTRDELGVPGPGINENQLKYLADDDPGFLGEMLQLFIKSSSEGLCLLKENAHQKNWDGVAHYAHKISSPCKHLGAEELSGKLKEIEIKARTRENVNDIGSLVLEVEQEIEILISNIGNYLENRKTG